MKKLLIVLGVLAMTCFGATCAAVIGFGVMSETGVIPATKAQRGSELPDRDIKWLRENGVILDGEEVQWFYSAALFSISDDGNLFTENAVISYLELEDELVVYAANFAEIEDIDVAWAEHLLEDTILTISTQEGEGFELWVSSEEELDKAFYADLMDRWRAAR